MPETEQVNFDVHLKPALAGPGEEPTPATIERFEPEPEVAIRCSRWLHGQGVSCHDTGFGLACSATRSRFEALFGVKLVRQDPANPASPWQMEGAVKVPGPIGDMVADVTLSMMPELF